nr:AAA family ATPase [Phenylobacterium aquaticum]
MVSELTFVLSELKAEDAQSAVEFRDKVARGQGAEGPEVTRLQKLTRLWALIFPGRELDLSTYEPKVSWKHPDRTTEPYSANQMSDGERGAMYLITRILRAAPGVVIVDEPEVHFHALLARAFWDIIEAERPDCRFIYITHDLPFALSRANARIGIVRSPTEVELVPENAPIPPALYESILGAASLSVVAKRIIFCEGKYDRSPDIHVYGAWFQSPGSVVVPVGSCTEVRQAVSVFKANPLIANAVPLGVVERDYWPESYLTKLSADGLHVLPAHEIEGLLCLRAVAEAVAAHVAFVDFPAAYAAFDTEVRGLFTGVRLNKLILERAKRDADCALVGLANSANPAPILQPPG